jgi:hypothetical protein
MTSVAPTHGLGTSRFKRFSHWKSVVNAIARLKLFVRRWKNRLRQGSPKPCETLCIVDIRREAHDHVLKEFQKEAFPEEISCLQTGKAVAKTSQISSLDPYLDTDGFIRVGGRLS